MNDTSTIPFRASSKGLGVHETSRVRTVFVAAGLVAIAFALFVRVAPLIDGGARLQRQCVTEDGYLMLTIARNIAMGHGFSVMDGTVKTNGTQPLATVLYAAGYRIWNGDKYLGLYWVVGVQVLISLMTAGAIYCATATRFCKGKNAKSVAILAATLWFVSPTSILHSQNSLETGLCALMIVLSIWLYDVWRDRFDQALCLGHCIALGALLGVTFLARIDNCFLIAAILAVHLVRGALRSRFKPAIAQSLIIGATSVVIATPWLWYNVSEFGHLVPVSGRAEMFGFGFGHNLIPSIVALVENVTVLLRVPGWAESHPALILSACALIMACVAMACRYRQRLSESYSPGVAALAVFVIALWGYYGLFFGMPTFLGRYLFPIVTLSALILASVSVHFLERDGGERRRGLPVLVIGVALIACVALNGRIFRQGKTHLHFQTVDWVAENVQESTWVGAIQTGTLGYYHDRTVNLDGKVNPEAFAYRKEKRIGEYVLLQNVEYIVDWASIAKWADWPEFSENYELFVDDEHRGPRGLAVLKRKHSAAANLSDDL